MAGVLQTLVIAGGLLFMRSESQTRSRRHEETIAAMQTQHEETIAVLRAQQKQHAETMSALKEERDTRQA